MATINVTNLFANENKRYSEAVVVTLPSILKSGGGRSQAQPEYIQGGDALTAQVVEEDTLIKKAYINIIEAFPVGALINVDIAGVNMFIGVDGTAEGVVVSTEEDNHFAEKQTVTTTVTGITGDVVTGKMSIILDTIHASLKNGQYAN
ncbi:MAG: hypothetical protein DRQ78_09565 [Epsilonproteobacteria bacterium]|nr:MAG: hypothetical protein DRQ78_09565 [Campylobacterota bacterium]